MWLDDQFFDFRKFQKRMERAFREFSNFDINLPATDISETDEEIIIKLDVPGIEKEDIDIIADENTIEIKAERKKFKEEEKENYYRRERGYKSYYREIPTPVKINPDKIEADYDSGVLTIKAEKLEKEEVKKKKIKVK